MAITAEEIELVVTGLVRAIKPHIRRLEERVDQLEKEIHRAESERKSWAMIAKELKDS
jgi:uncharacterized protein YdcH (DUF465 family)